MTSIRAPFDTHAHHSDVDNPPWDRLYNALLNQLSSYIDLAVAQALEAHGLTSSPAKPVPSPTHARKVARDPAPPVSHPVSLVHDQADRHIASGAVPPWLEPFGLPDNVRFTRTPDLYLRPERMPAQPVPFEDTEDLSRPDMTGFDPDLPAWRRPFTLPPNVRINRTPERRPAAGLKFQAVPEVVPDRTPDGAVGVAPVDPFAEALSWFGIMADKPEPAAPIAANRTRDAMPVEALEASHDARGDELIAQAWAMLSYPVPAAVEDRPGPAQIQDEAHDTPEDKLGFTMDHMISALLDHAEAQPGEDDAVLSLPHPDDVAEAETGAWIELVEPIRRSLSTEVADPREAARLPVRPIGIASPDDARAFIGPARNDGGRKASKAGPGSARQAPAKAEPALWQDPPLDLLIEPPAPTVDEQLSSGALEQNARLLEGVLEEFGVRGEIIDVRPGPVVTLYELEPAPGTKSSRVIGLSDDIARSMSAVSARVAVVQGRNVIGIELPNQRRETVFLRELVGAPDFAQSKHKLAIALGKTIGGEAVIVDLARMPHLLVAGTTGSGKSVAINTMILSLLYRLRPEECRLIMIDPKMLELSIYEGIPHLLTPVVTDPKKAVVALKWAVREMEDRYKKMSKVGVRNIDGFNARVAEAALKGEVITRTVQTAFNRDTGEPIFETEQMDLAPLPFIVVIVDEMADLMMVAGKDIEGAIQRLAQMARAAGIHLIMATQRPSVDVITGTIKANFPTRISFQVTSKIDSRTILGEQGAEQLLGQGDMLHMAGGGRISRVHGPFVSDGEVEKVVAHLKTQGQPDYLDAITEEADEGEEPAASAAPGSMDADESADLYDRAVAIVLRDKKCSTSYIQRRLSVGYNKAASLVERMEREGVVAPANHAGKREILAGGGVDRGAFDLPDED